MEFLAVQGSACSRCWGRELAIWAGMPELAASVQGESGRGVLGNGAGGLGGVGARLVSGRGAGVGGAVQ